MSINSEVKKVRKRAIFYAIELGFSNQAEDIAQEVLLKRFALKRGITQTVRSTVIDAIRARFGRPKSAKSLFKLASELNYEILGNEFSSPLKEENTERESGRPRNICQSDDGKKTRCSKSISTRRKWANNWQLVTCWKCLNKKRREEEKCRKQLESE